MRKIFRIIVSTLLFVMFSSSCTGGYLSGSNTQNQNPQIESEKLQATNEPTKVEPTAAPSVTAFPSATGVIVDEIEVTPTTLATNTPNPYITATPDLASAFPAEYNPLTGETAVYPENLLRSPLMVKISNYPREIRPQAGLSKADIVFEYYIGAFMNRFLAVFYGENAEWAGPIRSGRLIDAQLAMNYHSALVYGGADERVNAVIKDPGVLGNMAVDTRVYDQCPPLCGTETHSLEGLYVNTTGMSEDLFNDGYDRKLKPRELETVVFSSDVPGEPAIENVEEIEVIISELCRSKWIFDEVSQQYIRWEEEADRSTNYVGTYDLLTPDQQIQVANVIILFSNYVVYDAMLHDVKIHYAEGVMPARFFRNGKMIEGTWSGFDSNKPLHFLAGDGSKYALAPGKSWIILVTEDSGFSQITDTMWRLDFITP